MSDMGSKRLRELAHDYYKGELSYESYRSERTRLLDGITEITGDDGCTRPATQPSNKSGMSGQSLEHKSERSWYLRRAGWLLIVAVITIILMVWAMDSGWLTLLLGHLDSADTAVYYAGAEKAGVMIGEDYRHLNG